MGEKDVAEKILADYNDVFSDIFNVLLLDGKDVIDEDDLEEEHPVSQYKTDDSRLHQQERDVLKRWKKKNIRLAILGLEHQSEAEKYMALRVIGYDGASYRAQLLNIEKIKEIVPVVTVVLYFGTEHKWNYPTRLKEVIKVPKELEPYVNDYEIHVFNVAWLEPEQIRQFKSDFRVVAEFFRDKRLGTEDFAKDKTRIRHVDAVLKLLTAVTKDRSYEEILKNDEEVDTMCEVAQRLKNEGRTIGWNEGRTAGWHEGRTAGWNEGMQAQKEKDEATIAELRAKLAFYEKQAQMQQGQQ